VADRALADADADVDNAHMRPTASERHVSTGESGNAPGMAPRRHPAQDRLGDRVRGPVEVRPLLDLLAQGPHRQRVEAALAAEHNRQDGGT
jgi:hypothetical protein